MSVIRYAIIAAAAMLLLTPLHILSAKLLMRRAGRGADSGAFHSQPRLGAGARGGLLTNIYLAYGAYLAVIWYLAIASRTWWFISLVALTTLTRYWVVVRIRKILDYEISDYPRAYKSYMSFFLWHYAAAPTSIVVDLAIFIVAFQAMR